MKLGEEFVKDASSCGVEPLVAKETLYRVLDDGYGRYFHSIFSEEDRQQPYLIQNIGAPRTSLHEGCRDAAVTFVKDHRLDTGRWRRDWELVATRAGMADRLARFQNGELGRQFLRKYGIGHSYTKEVVAKRILMDVIAYRGCEGSIFDPDDLKQTVHSALIRTNAWKLLGLCKTEFIREVEMCARDFVTDTLHLFTPGAPIIGLTFGWADGQEWHLYGSITSTSIFHCALEYVPWVFGAVNYESDHKMTRDLYDRTMLVVAAFDAKKEVLPECYGRAYMHTLPTSDILECKWVGRLSDIFGPYRKVATMVERGVKNVREVSINV